MEHLIKTFPLLEELKDTPQDPHWHAEGDVYTHTEMVLEELEEALERCSVGSYQSKLLRHGAALHDIGKALTTKKAILEEGERVVSPRHAERGRDYVAQRIHQLDLNTNEQWNILSLIGHHHDPKDLFDSNASCPRWVRLSCLADPTLLTLLEKADIKGRICEGKEDQIEVINLFLMECQEKGIDHFPGTFFRDWQKKIYQELDSYNEQTKKYIFAQSVLAFWEGMISTPEEAIARSYQYRDNYSHLIVMCGPSGTGKSTWIKENYSGYHAISLDQLRGEITGDKKDHSSEGKVRQLSKERLKGHLREGENVIWDATNIRRDFRKVPLGLGGDYNAFTTLVTMWVPKEAAQKGNRNRESSIPPDIIERQYKRFQFPFPDEAHEVIFLDEFHKMKKRFLGSIDKNHLNG